MNRSHMAQEFPLPSCYRAANSAKKVLSASVGSQYCLSLLIQVNCPLLF